jgi:VanZ family protein
MAKFASKHFLAPGIWAFVILMVSSIPRLAPPPLGLTFTDKIAHFSEYLVLGVLSLHAFFKSGYGGRNSFRAAFVICAAYGMLDELHQYLIPGRTVEILDMIANISGSLAGAGLTLIFKSRVMKPPISHGQPPDAK